MKTTINQSAAKASNSKPDKEVIIGEGMALAEPLRAGHRGIFNKLLSKLDQSEDDRPFEPPAIREKEAAAAPLVAAFAEWIEPVRQSDPAIANLFNARLKRALADIDAGRALTLTPPVGSHTGHQKYFASLLRNKMLEQPDPIEPDKFYGLNSIRNPNGDGTAGWCMWFADDSGGAFGRGRSADDLFLYHTPGEKTPAETRRFRQNIDAAHAALRADAEARRR